jgi:uncharacterized membrane protein
MIARRWPEAVAVLAAAALFATLPDALVPGPTAVRFVVPALEAVLAVLLVFRDRRRASIALIALIGAGNLSTLGFLIHQLLYSGGVTGRSLLYSAFSIWVTNVIVFALLYWELDGQTDTVTDFAFVQMTDPEVRAKGWHPRFTDYLYLAYTNASAFSPTDTMPLTRRAKMLMLVQSAVSIVTLLLVAARAVNILTQ